MGGGPELESGARTAGTDELGLSGCNRTSSVEVSLLVVRGVVDTSLPVLAMCSGKFFPTRACDVLLGAAGADGSAVLSVTANLTEDALVLWSFTAVLSISGPSVAVTGSVDVFPIPVERGDTLSGPSRPWAGTTVADTIVSPFSVRSSRGTDPVENDAISVEPSSIEVILSSVLPVLASERENPEDFAAASVTRSRGFNEYCETASELSVENIAVVLFSESLTGVYPDSSSGRSLVSSVCSVPATA